MSLGPARLLCKGFKSNSFFQFYFDIYWSIIKKHISLKLSKKITGF